MAYLHDDVLDNGLQELTDATSVELRICSSEPATRAAAVSATLGDKTGISVGSPEDGDSSGRKVVIPAVTDGDVSASGTASHWALIDGTRLLAAEALASTQGVTSGNTWSTPAIDVTIPDPA